MTMVSNSRKTSQYTQFNYSSLQLNKKTILVSSLEINVKNVFLLSFLSESSILIVGDIVFRLENWIWNLRIFFYEEPPKGRDEDKDFSGQQRISIPNGKGVSRYFIESFPANVQLQFPI